MPQYRTTSWCHNTAKKSIPNKTNLHMGMYITFSATNESENTDLAETTNSAAHFDVCELSPIQQIFLCDQAAKYENLLYTLNFAGYTYEKCEGQWSEWPKFFWFRCPPIALLRADGSSIPHDEIIIFLSGSAEPEKAIVFSFYPEGYPTLFVSAWMAIDLEILSRVEEAPGEFGLGNVAAQISESSESETDD